MTRMKPLDWMLPLLMFVLMVSVGCVEMKKKEQERREAAEAADPSITQRIDGYNDPTIRTFITEITPGVQVACVYTYRGLWCTRYYQGGGDW